MWEEDVGGGVGKILWKILQKFLWKILRKMGIGQGMWEEDVGEMWIGENLVENHFLWKILQKMGWRKGCEDIPWKRMWVGVSTGDVGGKILRTILRKIWENLAENGLGKGM